RLQARQARLSERIEVLERANARQSAQIRALSDALSRAGQDRKAAKGSPSRKEARKPAPPAPLIVPSVEQADAARMEAEKNAYTAAWLALKGGRYDEAEKGFRKVLKEYLDGEYADQAWYWLGETLMARKQPEAAIKAFRHVVERFPKSIKRAAAMLRWGDVLLASGKKDAARQRYHQLLREYPDAAVAESARKALRSIESGAVEGGTR
ncbi:MAG: tol-pal system protein YbgF, partial [Mariprofundaceae bacterium]